VNSIRPAVAIGAPMTPEQYNAMRWEKEIDERNRPFADEELDSMLPSDGYKAGRSQFMPRSSPHSQLLPVVVNYDAASNICQAYCAPLH
jgi:splicing factor 3B subunit 1